MILTPELVVNIWKKIDKTSILKKEDIQIERLSGGVCHSVYKVTLKNDRQVVMKGFLKGQKLDPNACIQQSEILQLMQKLNQYQDKEGNSVKLAPCPLGWVQDVAQANWLVMESIPGELATSFSKTELCEVGRQIARFHLQTQNFQLEKKPNDVKAFLSECYQSITRTLKAPTTLFKELAYFRDLTYFALGTVVYPQPPVSKLPAGICHNDFRPQNLIPSQEQGIIICDFELSANGPLIYDLAYACLTHGILSHQNRGKEFDFEPSEYLLKGYHEIRPLKPIELECFKQVLIERARLDLLGNQKLALVGKPPGSLMNQKVYRDLINKIWANKWDPILKTLKENTINRPASVIPRPPIPKVSSVLNQFSAKTKCIRPNTADTRENPRTKSVNLAP